MNTNPHRRSTDSLKLSRDRFLLNASTQDEHCRGWVHFGMSKPLPVDASDEFRIGYDDHRSNVIAHLAAQVQP